MNDLVSPENLSQFGTIICRDFRSSEPTESQQNNETNKEWVRVVVWNIERGYKLRGIIDELIKLDPDVLLLQEVDIFTGRYVEKNELIDEDKEIATALKMTSIAAIEMSLVAGGAQCNTIMTKYNVKNPCAVIHASQPIDRTIAKSTDDYPRRGLRTAACAVVETPFGDVLFYSDHFEMDCGMEGRLSQLKDLMDDAELQESEYGKPQSQVIAGDLNTWSAGIARVFKSKTPLSSDLFGVATESEFWNQAIFYDSSSGIKRPDRFEKWNHLLPVNPLPGFSDPFGEEPSVRVYGGLYQAKLDWALVRNIKCINKFMGNYDLSLSDHKYLCVDIAPQ